MSGQRRPESERRLVLRVLARWQSLCEDRALPPLEALTAEALGEDWSQCFSLELDDPANPRLVWVGEAFLTPEWRPGPESRIAEVPRPSLLSAATSFIPRVLDRRIPICIGDTTEIGARPFMFRAILLPLSTDGERVDALFGAANGREIDAAQQ